MPDPRYFLEDPHMQQDPKPSPPLINIDWIIEYTYPHTATDTVQAAYAQSAGDVIELKNAAHQVIAVAPKAGVRCVRRADPKDGPVADQAEPVARNRTQR